MDVFEIVVALLLAGAALTGLSRRIGVPYPALLALAGAVLALLPWTPRLSLDPNLALTLFVAPVLLDAAFDASTRDLRANRRSVLGLAIGAVFFTTAIVALVARALMPAMPWAVAIALGAVVAPPDAAAATAVLKQLDPPQRLLVILEGESLFNDASALIVYRLAIGAAVAGSLTPTAIVPALLIGTVGSVVLGLALVRVVVPVLARVHDVSLVVVVQFSSAFGVWMLAERLHLSPILTVVVFAMSASRRAAGVTPARIRIPSYAVWEVAVYVLNALAFILVGFQLKSILGRLDAPTLARYVVIASVICGAVIIARIVWVAAVAASSRRRLRLPPGDSAGRSDEFALSRRAATVIGWCGMRGIVTLAAALAIPETSSRGTPFPYRDLIVFTAFVVVLGTLVVQGMTLRPLIRWIALEDDGLIERETRKARAEMYRAALAAIADQPGEGLSQLLRRRYEVALRRAQPGEGCESITEATREDAKTVRLAVHAEREKLLALREDDSIGDAAFQRLEEELDLEELHLRQFDSHSDA